MTATLLFDLDGTICETDWAHLKAFEIVFGELGIPMNEAIFKAKIMGGSNAMIGNAFFPDIPLAGQARILERKEVVYRGIVGDVQPVHGLIALLDWADAHKVPCGIVTNAPRENANQIVDGLGIRHRFKTLVCGQELARGKPDPLAYLTGLQELGGSSAHSVAFEDSPAGMQSAIGSGLPVIGMTTNLDAAGVLGHGAALAAKDFGDSALLAFVRKRTNRH